MDAQEGHQIAVGLTTTDTGDDTAGHRSIWRGLSVDITTRPSHDIARWIAIGPLIFGGLNWVGMGG